VMDLVDVDSVKWSSYADSSPWPAAALYRAEARGVRRLERRAVECCDAVVLVSQAEIEAMPISADNLLAVGNGVDTDYFHPSQSPTAQPSPQSLVFTGQMDYRPNVEGVCWFVREVWALLRRDFPELRFCIVGREPAPAVRRLAQTPGVVVTGAVPDVRPHLWSAAVAVCPLKIAPGIQNKILEAMACGVAVVASPPAAEGLGDEVRAHLHVAQSPQEWAKAVGLLLSDGQRRAAAGSSGRRWVELRHTWSAQLAPMITLTKNLCERASMGAANCPSLLARE
jgi:polysaccharide biosynthesis protein PslH